MKKAFGLFLSLLLVFSSVFCLTACNSEGGNNGDSHTDNDKIPNPDPTLYYFSYRDDGTYAIAPKSKSNLPAVLALM